MQDISIHLGLGFHADHTRAVVRPGHDGLSSIFFEEPCAVVLDPAAPGILGDTYQQVFQLRDHDTHEPIGTRPGKADAMTSAWNLHLLWQVLGLVQVLLVLVCPLLADYHCCSLLLLAPL